MDSGVQRARRWVRTGAGALGSELGVFGVVVGCVTLLGGMWTAFAPGKSPGTLYISDLLPVALAALAATCAVLVARSCDDEVALVQAWRWVAVAMTLRTAADAIWSWLELVRHTSPFPSLADVGYVLFYPAVLAAFWSLPAVRRSRGDLVRLGLDAGTLVVAGTVAVWYFILAPTLDSATTWSSTVVLNVVYPVGDMLLVFAVGASMLRRSALVPLRPMQWLVAATVSLLIGDLVFAQQTFHAGYDGAGVPDLFWTIGLGGFTLAAVAQRRHARVSPTFMDRRAQRESLQRVSIAPYIGATVSCALLLIVVRGQALYPTLGVVIGAITVTALVVARQLAAMSDNRRLLAAYQHLATTDPLTGLATRGHLLDVATFGFDESAQLCVLMIDIDHFKSINDRYGHHVGDAALRHVADLCRLHTRDTDGLTGRYGGDEIVVTLFDVNAAAATAIAERIQSAIRMHPLHTADGDVAITVSIGVAARQPKMSDVDELLRRADEALYTAKDAGRDLVRCAELM